MRAINIGGKDTGAERSKSEPVCSSRSRAGRGKMSTWKIGAAGASEKNYKVKRYAELLFLAELGITDRVEYRRSGYEQ